MFTESIDKIEKSLKKLVIFNTKREGKMKTATTIIIIMMLLGAAFAETTVSGVATGVWDALHSPYYVTSDVNVPSGEQLIVQPGVEIIFQGHYTVQVDAGATLKAIGTLDNPIIFTAADTAVGYGGLVFYQSSDACTLAYVEIEYAKKTGTFPFSFGGAVLAYQSNPTIINSQISHNSAQEGCGGGIAAYYANPTIKHNIIIHNSAFYSGGAIFTLNSEPIIENNIVAYNHAFGSGGAIAFSENSSPTLVNNVIHGNVADSVGGAIDCAYSSNPSIINNTIVENIAGVKGGAITASYASNPMVMNSIIQNNSAPDSSEVYLYGFSGYPCEIFTSHSNIDLSRWTSMGISNISAGAGNIDAMSAFEDSLYHISPLSPNIDAGAENDVYGEFVLTAPFYDHDGISRPIGASFDIGAYEYRPTAAMNLFPDSLEYGDVEITTDAHNEITIASIGTGELIVYNIYSTNPAFVPDETYLTLSPDSSVDVGVVFTPTEDTAYDDTLWVCSNADTQFVLLRGSGATPPNMVISDSVIDFGVMMEGSTATATIEISNAGEMNLHIFELNTTNAAFSIPDTEFTVSSGEYGEIPIVFSPREVRPFADTLWVFSNDDTQFVLLFADVRRKPTISLSDTLLDFGSVPQGTTKTMQFTMTNTGDFDLTIDHIEISNPAIFSVSDESLSTIEPGASQTITATVTVYSVGESYGTAWFYSEYDTASLMLYVKERSSEISGDNEKLPETAELLVYPNPFNSAVNIELNSTFQNSDGIDIIDMNGRRIAHLEPGENTWNANNTVSGTYFATTKVGDKILQKRITYLK